jgi:AraC family transcriptional regulator, arabinose operon regulatory protein
LRDITPAPEPFPILAGIQHQAREYSRGYRPEGTRDWLMVTTLSGAGYVKAGTEIHRLARGDIVLIAPDTAQEYGYLDEDSGWSNVWVHFRPRPHWLDWLAWPQLSRGVMLVRTGEAFAPIEAELVRMVEVSRSPGRLRFDAALNSLERVLIAVEALSLGEGERQVDHRIRAAQEIVGARLSEPMDIGGLGQAVGLSRSRFTLLFTEQTGLSPQAYIEITRLARAAQMLQSSSWSVTQVAEDVGFANAYYFSTRFRRRYGMPPSAYREAFRRR